MTSILSTVGSVIATMAIGLASLFSPVPAPANTPVIEVPVSSPADFSYASPEATQEAVVALASDNVGANPSAAADFRTSLATGISSSADSMTLVSFTSGSETLITGRSYGFKLGGREYVQGTAASSNQITGMTRGISHFTGTTSVASYAASWGRGTAVEITDAPILLYMSNIFQGTQNIEHALYFDTLSTSTIANSPRRTIIPTADYVDFVGSTGCANAGLTTRGCIQLATQTQAASSTVTGSTGAILAYGNGIATDTPNTGTKASRILMSDMTGVLKQSWLDIFTTSNAWSGLNTFNAGLITTASSTLNSTTTIAASNALSKALVLNKIPYAFPATQGIQNSVLTNNGSGTLSWTLSGSSLGTTTATTTAMGQLSATLPEMTLVSMSIPGASLGTSSVVTWDVPISTLTCSGSTNGCNQTIKIKYGGTTICTITPSFGTVSGGNNQGILRAKIIGNGLTNSQAGSCYFFATIGQQTYGAISGIQLVTTGSSAIDSTASQTLSLTIAISEGSGMLSDFGVSVGTVSLAK